MGYCEQAHCRHKVRFAVSILIVMLMTRVSSVAEVEKHDTHLLKHLAKHFNLTYTAFGEKFTNENAPASGALTLSDAFGGSLEPAPITPTGNGAAPYQLLSGTIKATFNAHRSLDDANAIIVAPSMMSGNTGVLNILLRCISSC